MLAMGDWPLGNFPDKFRGLIPIGGGEAHFGRILAACLIVGGLFCCFIGAAGAGIFLLVVGVIW
jgi:hypothetical protein